MISKEAVMPLGRYADLIALLGFLPVLAYVKFGHILRHKRLMDEMAAKETKKAAKAKVSAKGDSKADAEVLDLPVDSGPAEGLPPLSALVLLLLAELCASTQMLDPADFQVRRAMGAVGRAQKSMKPGFLSVLEDAIKLLENDDVYACIRFSCMISIILSLIVAIVLNVPREIEASNPLKQALRSVARIFWLLINPRVWFTVFLVGSFMVGNWASIVKTLRRPATMEFIHCLALLFRAMAALVLALSDSSVKELQFWCTSQAVAAIARAAFTLGIERITLHTVLKATTAPAVGAHGMLIMEALTAFFFLPAILRSKKMIPVFLLLCVPCAAIIVEGDLQKQAEAFLTLPMVAVNMSTVLGISSVMLLFMSGTPGVFSLLGLMQGMFALHRLDTVKF